MCVSSYDHCGDGRLKSVPVEYQWAPSRTMISPERGQLTESFAHPPPAATQTTFGLSYAADVIKTSSQFATTTVDG